VIPTSQLTQPGVVGAAATAGAGACAAGRTLAAEDGADRIVAVRCAGAGVAGET
jgi:hypothetical protein